MRASLFVAAALAVTGACLSLVEAFGQAGQPITVKGRILGSQGFLVTVQGEGGPMIGSLDPSRVDGGVRLQGMPAPKIEITGTGSLESLEKGLMVRFSVELDNRKAVGEVTEITVVGLEGWGDVVPGLVPEGAAPVLPGEEGPKQPKQPAAVSGKFTATGTISSFKAGNLLLAYGAGRSATLQVKISELAAVKIESRDPRMIRIGDMASLEGATGAPGRMFVGTLTVMRDANIDKPMKPAKPVAVKPQPNRPMKNDPAAAEKPAEPAPMPTPPPADVARPRTKGKVITIN